MTSRVPGRGWAYFGAILGGAVSIAANVAHSYVPPTPPDGAPPVPADWTPQAGAVVGAIFWPVALFVAVEILARVAWPEGRRWSALRFGGLVPVATVAAIVSYKHLSGLLAFYGEDGLTATIGPLAVDGLMIMATGALLATGIRAHATPAPEKVPAPVTEAAPVPAAEVIEPASPAAPKTTPAPVIEPASTPDPTPAPAPKLDDRSRRATARTAYRRSVTAGTPLSGAALGRQFGMSDRWGRDRVNEVRATATTNTARRAPAVPAELPAAA
ncbi:hypothetical protein [Salinispora sp. H7-4]|uniref:hypothetical protein n=1 Tax=Salinispora sp. H7-4 TaxID=2748321 RepID=UPI0015D249A9|nr:hypothetical protein [Salinispora sp. H7-4]NYT93738.1 hypothetical protein [Salinispora sp. H7-4]